MKTNYDVIVVGAATAGSYFARKLAENGVSVLVIDSKPVEKVGTKYDIFHVGREDFDKFGIPWPVKGEDYAFEFDSTHVCSAFGHYPKYSPGKVVARLYSPSQPLGYRGRCRDFIRNRICFLYI